MTPEETKQLLETIIAELNQAGSVASAFAPQYQAIFAIGMAVDKLIPGMVADVQNWIQGNVPTEAEKADTASKLAVLGNPNLP